MLNTTVYEFLDSGGKPNYSQMMQTSHRKAPNRFRTSNFNGLKTTTTTTTTNYKRES